MNEIISGFKVSKPQSTFVPIGPTDWVLSTCTSPSYVVFQDITTSDKYISPTTLKNLDKKSRMIEKIVKRAKDQGIEPPSDWAKSKADGLLSFLDNNGVKVEFFNPSPEGGVMIEFLKSGQYFLVEIFNDKDIVLLKRRGDKRKAWDLTEYDFLQKTQEEVLNGDV